MAIVSSRKAIHLKDIDRLNQRKTQILDQVLFEIGYAEIILHWWMSLLKDWLFALSLDAMESAATFDHFITNYNFQNIKATNSGTFWSLLQKQLRQ